MSIYGYLGCLTCKEDIFVKDADSDVHANPKELGEFLEKHCGHSLVYEWEDSQESGAFTRFKPKQ